MSLGEAFPALAFRFFQTTLKKNSFAPYFSFHAGSLERFFPLPCFSESLLPKASFFLVFSFPEAPLPRFLLLFSPICSPCPRLKNCRETFSRIAAGFSLPPAKKESPFAQKDGACPSSVFLFVSVSLRQFAERRRVRLFQGVRLYLRKFASPIFYIRDAFAARLRHRSTPRRPFSPAFSQLPTPLP